MGRTYRNQYDEDFKTRKHAKHSNNHKQGGMRILNDHQCEDDDLYDDVNIDDDISFIINKNDGHY